MTTGEEDWLANLIRDEIKNKANEEELREIIAVLTKPAYSSFANKEHIDLLKIALLIKKSKNVLSPIIQKKLKKHADKYYWIENSYYAAPVLDAGHFFKKIKDTIGKDIEKELKDEINRIKQNKKEKQNLFKKLKLSRFLKNLIRTSEKFTYLQDTRKEGVYRVNHFIFKFMDEFSKRLNIDKKLLYASLPYEIEDIFIKRRFNINALKERLNGCMVIYLPPKYYVISGEEYRNIDKGIFHGEIKEGMILKGVCASPGNARGKVYVVVTHDDLKNFKDGSILVTNNTTPDFVPVMKKAKAIITEQGGITTHAAIVSRELGVPCIIGIKNATRSLKNGDIVEVDAEKGIVKRVS